MSKKQMELRFQSTEIRANEDGSMKVSGYVNQSGQLSEILGGSKKFREKIAPGAFKRAIQKAKHDIDLLAEHDSKQILASTVNGSLQLREDKKGLYFEADLIDTSTSRDYHQLIKSGILNSMSFGFSVVSDNWKKLSNGLQERTINDLELFEVSAVRHPAYSQSNVQARGYDIVNETREEDEETITIKKADLESLISKMEKSKEESEAIQSLVAELQAKLSENSDNNEENQRSIQDEQVYKRIQQLKGEIT